MAEASQSETIKIFVSHKSENSEAAKNLASILTERSPTIETFLAKSDMRSGDVFPTVLLTQLRKCDLLLLLYHDPKEDWTWPIYEVGAFTPVSDDHEAAKKRIVCMHHCNFEPPEPIRHYQAVSVTPVARPADQTDEAMRKALEAATKANSSLIEQFIEPLYVTGELTGRPAHPGMSEDVQKKIAFEIAQEFQPPKLDEKHWVYRLAFDYPPDTKINPNKIPDEVSVQNMNVGGDKSAIFDLFGINRDNVLWEEIRADLKERSQELQWMKQLAKSIHLASNDRDHDAIMARFRGGNGKVYRPVLHKVGFEGSRPARFEVLFVIHSEDIDAGVANPSEAFTVFNMLRIGNHLLSNVVGPALRELQLLPANRKEQVYEPLFENMGYILEWANRHGFLDKEKTLSSFSKTDQVEIEGLWCRWDEHTNALYDAAKRDNAQDVQKALEDIKKMNLEWTQIAAKRYAELVVQ